MTRSSTTIGRNKLPLRELYPRLDRSLTQKGPTMLRWAITFLILAVVAAILGFGGLAGAFAGVAQIAFFVFIALVVITFISRAFQGKSVS